ncbi:hypothetical protein EV191_115117 [Tamaricihabitans halophyticus]|uniref:Uncharacterized protein n=1 Tax=Tamaricihabitans halophyticus TaxID=1262583 RepID=A0A4R2QA73_9PSEU|nr:hypothetical protein EV191_115117 [Tamaricihabitans halophyticus]
MQAMSCPKQSELRELNAEVSHETAESGASGCLPAPMRSIASVSAAA